MSTINDENSPMTRSPSQVSTSAARPRDTRRAARPKGINNAEATSSAANSAPPSGKAATSASAGTTRQPTQACNRMEISNSGAMAIRSSQKGTGYLDGGCWRRFKGLGRWGGKNWHILTAIILVANNDYYS